MQAIVDADDNVAFTGSQGDGTYQIKFVQEQVAWHPTENITYYTLVYGENNIAIVEKIA